MRGQELKTNNRHILWLDVARVFAIISITCNHAVNRVWANAGDQRGEFYDLGMLSTVMKTLISVFSRIGVPIFLMITGALLLKKKIENTEDVKRFYKHNLLRMFITAEIWYAIMYWFKVLWDPANQMLETMSAWELIWGTVKNGLFMDQVTLGSMWYMPMILCLYLVIPLIVVIKNQVSLKVLLPAMVIVFLSKMGIPNYNSWVELSGIGKTVSFELSAANLFSFYLLYVFAGYWLSQGGWEKLPTWAVAAGAVVVFGVLCVFQFWAYSRPTNYLVAYDFGGMLLCAMFVFELIRRCGDSLERLRVPIVYLSKISFGIYFVHVLIVWDLYWYVDCSSMSHTVWFLFLELVPVLGSVVVIAILSWIPFCKKYLFMIH